MSNSSLTASLRWHTTSDLETHMPLHCLTLEQPATFLTTVPLSVFSPFSCKVTQLWRVNTFTVRYGLLLAAYWFGKKNSEVWYHGKLPSLFLLIYRSSSVSSFQLWPGLQQQQQHQSDVRQNPSINTIHPVHPCESVCVCVCARMCICYHSCETSDMVRMCVEVVLYSLVRHHFVSLFLSATVTDHVVLKFPSRLESVCVCVCVCVCLSVCLSDGCLLSII